MGPLNNVISSNTQISILSKNQLEKLEAARSAYLWLTLVTGPDWALLGLTGPYWALLGLTSPYWASLGLTRPY